MSKNIEVVQMARPVDDKNREAIKKRITDSAHKIFCEKGFIDVTMTDLINAAKMSRGGFYFYYKSVEEVFQDTIQIRKKIHMDQIRKSLESNTNFNELLDDYFKIQKTRLLNMKNSMLRALYEYLFQHTQEVQFRREQKDNVLVGVKAVLYVGLEQDVIHEKNIDKIAEHFMYTIEGLDVMALFQGLSEETIDRQFEILRNMLK